MEDNNSYKKEVIQLIAYSILILLCTYFSFFFLENPIADERFHWAQIKYLYNGDFVLYEKMTVFPGYHAIIAFFLKISNSVSIKYARFIHLLLSMLAIPVFYFICKELKQKNINYRSLLFLCCPIILHLFSVIYTDVPAILFVLLMFLFTLKERYILSAFCGAIAIVIRQPNLVWVTFCGAYIAIKFWENVGWRGVVTINDEWWATARKIFPLFIISCIAVALFVANKGVALSSEKQYHEISFNISNLYFYFFIMFILQLPQCVAYFPRMICVLKNNKLIFFGVLFLFCIYYFTYSNAHPYNSLKYSYFLMNVILHYTANINWLKAITFIPITISAFTLCFMWIDSNKKPELLLLYIFSMLFFIVLPLVTPRYYITSIAFLYILKPHTSFKINEYTLMLYLFLDCFVLAFTGAMVFFI